MSKMKTDPDIDEVVRDLVEWMDGWRKMRADLQGRETDYEWVIRHKDGHIVGTIYELKNSLDLVREIEVAVVEYYKWEYKEGLKSEVHGCHTSKCKEFKVMMADPKDRLIALHRTLVEANEIQQEG